ncbi:MAG: hypothetical protein CM1200mP1_06500 [Candidatus Neomarinimicrobiota bacterium]|nr:MAG: hypothetical protein CM1200mP1_06500 [Candidatus Neomarinimicrobiota bacterium]
MISITDLLNQMHRGKISLELVDYLQFYQLFLGWIGIIINERWASIYFIALIGAGTGLIYILRWFWWRINAYTEIVAMISSLVIAAYFNFGDSSLEEWEKIVFGAILTTLVWIVATFVTPPDDEKTLQNFVNKINPGGPGWSKYSTPTTEPFGYYQKVYY